MYFQASTWAVDIFFWHILEIWIMPTVDKTKTKGSKEAHWAYMLAVKAWTSEMDPWNPSEVT